MPSIQKASPLVFMLTAVAVGFALFSNLDAPILDSFGFRQAQTAISTRWLIENGPSLIYATPVLGYPWEIPFEFPTYQNLVALVGRAGIELETAGRLVSIAFFLGLLPGVYMLMRALGLSSRLGVGTATIVLASPLYVFWSRTFMIESAALFFSIWWLVGLVKFLTGYPKTWFWASIALASGILAVLTKATTFPAFCVAGCLIAFFIFAWPQIAQGFWRERLLQAATPVAFALLLAILPLLAGMAWVAASDAVKAANGFGAALTSDALRAWNFGSLEQRISREFWVNTVAIRTGFEVFGYTIYVFPIMATMSILLRETRIFSLIAIVAGLTPFIVFTNLHYVHNYYPYANAIFWLIAFSLGLWGLSKVVPRVPYEVLVGATVLAQITFYTSHYSPIAGADQKRTDDYRIAAAARELTPPDSMLIIFGREWSSEIPFYANRKSLAIPGWADAETVRKAFADLSASSGGIPVGGVVICGSIQYLPPHLRPYAEKVRQGAQLMAEAGSCSLSWPDIPEAVARPERTIQPSLLGLLQVAQVREAPYGLAPVPEGLFAHPPSTIVMTSILPRRVEGSVGFLSSTPLDKASVFIAEIKSVDSAGVAEVLFSARLDPRVIGHAPQRFAFDTPGAAQSLVFTLRPDGEATQYGWLYWGN